MRSHKSGVDASVYRMLADCCIPLHFGVRESYAIEIFYFSIFRRLRYRAPQIHREAVGSVLAAQLNVHLSCVLFTTKAENELFEAGLVRPTNSLDVDESVSTLVRALLLTGPVQLTPVDEADARLQLFQHIHIIHTAIIFDLLQRHDDSIVVPHLRVSFVCDGNLGVADSIIRALANRRLKLVMCFVIADAFYRV